MKILIVEDDQILSRNIGEALRADGYVPEMVYDGLIAERMFRRTGYDCIVLDVNIPGRNGFDLCRIIREHDPFVPIIMLTAFGELEDKIEGFECGADDYLTKPFYMRELILRIRSLLKRAENKGSAEKQPVLSADDIILDKAGKKVSRQGREIRLTPREYQILLKLMEKNGEIVSKAELIKSIWGSSFAANTNTIEVYINFLRNKIDKPFDKNTIRTRIGYGYYLEVNEDKE